MRLRWKKHAKETGLRAVGAGPRGSDLHDGTNRYATVAAHSFRHTGEHGWWWHAQVGTERINTCNTCFVSTDDEAKKQAEAWVKERLVKEQA
jgi:hypothetical protein